MFELLGIPPQALFGQLLLGLINGSFYAILSLGLAVIFGLLNIINFAHGAQYMLGAFVAWMSCCNISASNYWAVAADCAPIIVGVFGVMIERLLILEALSNTTISTACCSPSAWRSIIQGLFRNHYGILGPALWHPAAA
jgi:branched-chain amino acid transport system permease protein